MKSRRAVFLALSALALVAVAQQPQTVWEDVFDVDKAALSATGTNPYFSLVPGHRLEYEGDGTRLVISVLEKTKSVDGVTCRVIEEREWEDGELIEVSRNYFAIDTKTKDVYYFGEEVDMYEGGRIVSHEGAWLSGRDGAKFGLMMPGKPTLGRAHYQEIAPKVAMDRAKLVDAKAKVVTPSKTFEDCIKYEETTPLEPKAKEYKYYASGVGLVQDSGLKLVRATVPGQAR
jgi:hypothetical protein